MMRATVQGWPQGGYIIVPDRHPPFPIIFATYAQALAYADTLIATPDTPAPLTSGAALVPPAITPVGTRSVDRRGPPVTDNFAVSTPTWLGDAANRHAPRGVSRGTGAAEHARRAGLTPAEHARRAGLTPAQYHLLRAVRAHPAYPAVTITALAARLHIRHQSACRRVAHAIAHGLLQRHPAATDRRLVLVSLTDTGAQKLDRVTRTTSMETATPQPPR